LRYWYRLMQPRLDRLLAFRRQIAVYSILLVLLLATGCGTWTPQPLTDPSTVPPRLLHEKLMLGPEGIGRNARIAWLVTIGLVTSPFWGIPLSYETVSRALDNDGRVTTRLDDPNVLAEQLNPNFEFGDYHALVIGNQNYQYLGDLVTPAADAEDVSTALRELYGFETTTIHDATRAEMYSALGALREELGPHDNLLIYYGGHGIFDEEVNEGYWMPVDANLELPSTWLATSAVSTMLRGIRAKHILIIADSCYSGGMTREVTPPRRTRGYIYLLANKPTRMVMTSGGFEPVRDDGGGTNSIFAKYFLTTLQENQTPVLEASKLFLRIREPIMENALQTPWYAPIRFAGHEGGDFLFLRRPIISD
jgi:hypothetical protein